MGFMHDTLQYTCAPGSRAPALAPCHDEITFGLLYAVQRRTSSCPLSHDEVVHGKGIAARRRWSRRLTPHKFAMLARLLRDSCGRYPGKKLLFMGQEFAHAPTSGISRLSSLDWQLPRSSRGTRAMQSAGSRSAMAFIASGPRVAARATANPTACEWLVADDS